jgi:predicted enzyme related to lactoylglutathione lyase
MPRVVHFEIHATDPDRLIAFYSGLFGWSFARWDGPVDYWWIRTDLTEGSEIDGGLVRRRGPAPAYGQAVNAYVCTVDVASARDTLNRAVGLGGSVATPVRPIPGVGWLGYVTDPDGNLLGVLQRDPTAS